MIDEKALEKVQGLLKDALDKGATLVTGGSSNDASELTYNPTVITDISSEMDIASEEIFGPIASIFTFTEEEEVIRRANDTIYGLAAYFYSGDYARSWRVSEGLEYGIIGHNTG